MVKNCDYAPIILFCFNRPTHFEKVFNSLKKNLSIINASVTIHIDGPRNKNDSIQISKINKIIKKNDKYFKNLKVIRRRKNYGCTVSLIKTLNQHFIDNEKAIVLEDDNLLSEYFYEYMNHSLSKYENNLKVFHICGYRFPITNNKYNKAEFYPLSIGWGWGTYKRAWKEIILDKKFIKKKILSNLKNKIVFSMFGINNYFKILDNAIKDNNKGWDICWASTILINKGYSLVPPVSFVKNIGHDNSGINSKKINIWDTKILNKPIKVIYPNIIKYSYSLYIKIVIFYIKKTLLRFISH